ncbi:hypothetical protein ACSBR2_006186 [Camellia fascicularis]
MWCQWVKSYLLKNRSFWSVKTLSDPSWVWRKILGLRSELIQHIGYKVGNERNTFLWFDNWHPLGPLKQRFGDRVIYDSGSQDQAKVESIIDDWRWRWPAYQTWELNEIKANVQGNPDNFEDKVIWLNSFDGCFSIQSA